MSGRAVLPPELPWVDTVSLALRILLPRYLSSDRITDASLAEIFIL